MNSFVMVNVRDLAGEKIIINVKVESSVSDPLFFFTDPDPTQKPKAHPDPDPGEILHAYNEK